MARFTSSKNLRDGPPCSSRLAASASTRQRRASAFETALRLNPSFSLAHGYYGLTLSYCGRWEEGTLAAERALLLSPRDPFSATYYGIASYAQFVGRNYVTSGVKLIKNHRFEIIEAAG